MSKFLAALAASLPIALGAACTTDPSDVPCVDDSPLCGSACDADYPCTSGMYCTAAGKCARACVAGVAALACTDGQVCNSDGSCGIDGPGTPDAGGGTGGVDPGSGGTPDTACTPEPLVAIRTAENLIFVIEQSAAMGESFDGTTRWTALLDTLTATPDGLLSRYDGAVNFGAATFTAFSEASLPGGGDPNVALGDCPALELVTPTADNGAALREFFSGTEPQAEAPTGEAVAGVVRELVQDPQARYAFVLVGEGDPVRCDALAAHDDASKQFVLSGVGQAYAEGIETFVLHLGDTPDAAAAAHHQAVANVGQGRSTGDADATYWTATDAASLRAALDAIVALRSGCEYALSGPLTGGPCDGSVALAGDELVCGTDWERIDERHIVLRGDACQAIQQDRQARVEVTRGCPAASDP